MSQNSKIEWTDHTFNPWWGCTKVSPACAHCYAETFSKRVGQNVWGDNAERRFFGGKHWDEPLKWNAKAKSEGRRARVFCASMADICEIHPNPEIAAKQEDARRQLAALMARTENLDWLLLSKRWSNFYKISAQLGWSWDGERWIAPPNAWVGATVENQEQADKRIPELLKIPAAVRFVSYEPALGPVDFSPYLPIETIGGVEMEHWVDWVICGGESGPGARPMHPDWARSVRDQCKSAGVPFLFKQWGEWVPIDDAAFCSVHDEGYVFPDTGERLSPGEFNLGPWVDADAEHMARVGKKAAGRLLDGVEHSELPEVTP